jgi:DNA-binding CsgD family transcriptional regulator
MLYGRDVERAEIWTLLEGARESRSGTLVLRGEAGIGKTALLEDARERASDMHVLGAGGVESESELPFAGLHQLLRPALGLVDKLPPPQAAALSGALGFEEGTGQERFLVFAACLSLLSELAERRPVLCLVDDAHWLDAGSGDALRFVARRLDAEGIVMLFAAREGDVRAFDAPDLPSLVLDGLDDEAAGTLLASGSGVGAAPAVRQRLFEQTRGNALALLEVPAALSEAQLAGEEPLPEALPLTRQVEKVFLERVHRLSSEAQRLLLVAAADDLESVVVVTRAGEQLGLGPESLDEAERAGLLSLRGQRVLFRHPLVRSAVYEAAPRSERWRVHRALAQALAANAEHADRRAWHLAAASVEPDEEVVRALDEAARRAEQRGAYEEAARALERAADLSSDAAARGRRVVGAAMAASAAGADDRAVARAREARRMVRDTCLLAESARVIGLAERRRGRPAEGHRCLIDGAHEAASVAPRLALELLMHASAAASEGGVSGGVVAATRLASEITPPEGDDESEFLSKMLAGWGAMYEGDPERGASLLELAEAWAYEGEDTQLVFWGVVAALMRGNDEGFAALVARTASLARSRGSLGVLAEALSVNAAQALLAQRLDSAALAAVEARRLAFELGMDNFSALPTNVLAVVAAVRGDDEEAQRLAGSVLELAAVNGLVQQAAMAKWALALLDLGRGRWADALERLEDLADVRPGQGDALLVLISLPDRIEAAVRAGRRDAALESLPVFEDWASQSDAPWARARLAGFRALVSEGEVAARNFDEAFARGADARPFDLARIQLSYGEYLRRERRRTDARVQLRMAVEGFERLRAAPWAERAAAELRATGEKARKRDPSTVDQLTPQELQIARMVAEGMRNKEVAAQLFLSPRTIDTHLRNVFSKLGVTSRTQLARLPLGADEAVAERAAASLS